jgi:hypothetical protein
MDADENGVPRLSSDSTKLPFAGLTESISYKTCTLSGTHVRDKKDARSHSYFALAESTTDNELYFHVDEGVKDVDSKIRTTVAKYWGGQKLMTRVTRDMLFAGYEEAGSDVFIDVLEPPTPAGSNLRAKAELKEIILYKCIVEDGPVPTTHYFSHDEVESLYFEQSDKSFVSLRDAVELQM